MTLLKRIYKEDGEYVEFIGEERKVEPSDKYAKFGNVVLPIEPSKNHKEQKNGNGKSTEEEKEDLSLKKAKK